MIVTLSSCSPMQEGKDYAIQLIVEDGSIYVKNYSDKNINVVKVVIYHNGGNWWGDKGICSKNNSSVNWNNQPNLIAGKSIGPGESWRERYPFKYSGYCIVHYVSNQ